jgi:MATE family multidrug resistance protein
MTTEPNSPNGANTDLLLPSANLPGQKQSFRQSLAPLFTLGWPMVLTQFFIMGTGFIDTAMAGRYSAADLAGVSLGGNVLWPVFMLLTGVTMALAPITSHLRGANKMSEIGHQIRQGLWLSLASSCLMILLLHNAAVIYEWTGIEPAIADIASDYLYAISWGVPPIIIYVALRHTLEGLGQTRPPMLIAGSVLPLNGFLNYALVYGEFGFPEMGGVGCGWATAIVFWVQLLLMLLLLPKPYFKITGLFKVFEFPILSTCRDILKLGIPIGIAIFLEMALFGVVGFLVARLGVVDMAAHSIAGNLNWMTYVIPMSIGSAASIRIGFLVGSGDLAAARSTAGAIFKFSIGYALAMSLVLIGLRYQLVSIFTNDPEVIAIAIVLILFIAVYQTIDDAQAVIIGALRGYKDTTIPMLFGLIGYWFLALPIGYILAEGLITDQPLRVYGYWAGIASGMFIVAICVGIRLRYISGHKEKILLLSDAKD